MELIEYIKKAIYINLIYEDRYELILSGLKATLILTIVSFVAGTLLGMAFCEARAAGTASCARCAGCSRS